MTKSMLFRNCLLQDQQSFEDDKPVLIPPDDSPVPAPGQPRFY